MTAPRAVRGGATGASCAILDPRRPHRGSGKWGQRRPATGGIGHPRPPPQRPAAWGKAKLSKLFSATRNHWYSSSR
jgi:hypothetical protein